MNLRRKTADLAVTGTIAAGALLLLWDTRSFAPSLLPGYPGDAFFPRIVLAFILLCAAVVILYTLARDTGDEYARSKSDTVAIDGRGLAVAAAFVAGYAAVLAFAGFELATFLFLAGLLAPRIHASGMRAWLVAALVSAAAVAVLYVCFVLLLGVSMPLLFLPQYLDF